MVVLIEPELHVGEDVVVPDVAGWALVATYADADVVRAQPFEAIALELASLWLPEKPPA